MSPDESEPAAALRLRAVSSEVLMPASNKAISLVLEDAELIEMTRILMDDDAEAALDFLKRHLKGKARELLEGG
jgi:hypothetical protein